jgi:hypothetical protein
VKKKQRHFLSLGPDGLTLECDVAPDFKVGDQVKLWTNGAWWSVSDVNEFDMWISRRAVGLGPVTMLVKFDRVCNSYRPRVDPKNRSRVDPGPSTMS